MNRSNELIIGVVLVILFLGFVFVKTIKKIQPAIEVSYEISPTPSKTASFSASEVTKHNKETDCWISINNNVYDVTTYIDIHPGGTKNITDYCGKEATESYNNVKKHGTRSNADLATLLVGILK